MSQADPVIIRRKHRELRRRITAAQDHTGADLAGAKLFDLDLHGKIFRDASLRGADLTASNLKGADLTGADLRTVFLTGAQPPRPN